MGRRQEGVNLPRLIKEAGLPPEAGHAMVHALEKAGYDLSDEGQQVMGVTALLAAMQVHEALTSPPARAGERTGRNDPCPCGSGRKYKKCCAGKEVDPADATGPGRFAPGSPLDEPELVPRLHNPESFAADMTNLERLFAEEPALGHLRFDAWAVATFVLGRLEARKKAGEEGDGPEEFAELVAQYLREVEGPETLGRLPAALLSAAPEVVWDDEDFRSLALALTLADLPTASEDHGRDSGADSVNPLHVLVFRQTLLETIEDSSGPPDEEGGEPQP